MDIQDKIRALFDAEIQFDNNLIVLDNTEDSDNNQKQTTESFTQKWNVVHNADMIDEQAEKFQKNWYLKLYGFDSEECLSKYLVSKKVILDAGCGLGYKAAWLAGMAPNAIILAMDLSESVFHAASKYSNIKNLFFIQCDIANTKIKKCSIDYVSCDQVIHHTSNPEFTFSHLSELLSENGEFSCYVYAKKALPRELVDDYFRHYCTELSENQLWELSKQLTVLGKSLAELNIEFESPGIPLLGIKGGRYDIQRFIYWNFLKCFWNEELGFEHSVAVNFDWYSPQNAKRFSEQEFKEMALKNKLKTMHFHSEEACYSGRFKNSLCAD